MTATAILAMQRSSLAGGWRWQESLLSSEFCWLLSGWLVFGERGASIHTALIPTWFGLALAVGGLLAISPSEGRRKLFMHINVTVGLLGFIGAAWLQLCTATAAPVAGHRSDMPLRSRRKLTMAGLLLIYVNLCIRSFIKARRSRQE